MFVCYVYHQSIDDDDNFYNQCVNCVTAACFNSGLDVASAVAKPQTFVVEA